MEEGAHQGAGLIHKRHLTASSGHARHRPLGPHMPAVNVHSVVLLGVSKHEQPAVAGTRGHAIVQGGATGHGEWGLGGR